MMNDLSKLYLFFSYTDPRYNSYATEFYNEFKKSEDYLSYITRSTKQKNNSDEKNRFNNEFETIEQVYVRLAQFYYLATTSYERYYINPLTIEEKNVSVNSIGDILIPFDNSLITINKVISIKGYTNTYKKKALESIISKWEKDAVENMKEPLKTIRESTTKYMLSKNFIVFNNIQYVFFFALNLLAVFFLFIPGLKPVWTHFWNGETLNTVTWTMLMMVALYDFAFCFYSMFFKRIIEPYYYTKRFLILKKKDLDKMVEKASNKLRTYVFNAIENKKTLRDDIKLFADVTEHKVDLNSLGKVNKKLARPLFKTITIIKNIIFVTMCFILVSYVIYLLIYSRTNGGLL